MEMKVADMASGKKNGEVRASTGETCPRKGCKSSMAQGGGRIGVPLPSEPLGCLYMSLGSIRDSSLWSVAFSLKIYEHI